MKNLIKLLLFLFVISFTQGCTKDFLDINDDPNVPKVADAAKLLSGSEHYMASALGQGNFIGNNLSSYVHQLVSREVQNYGMNPLSNNIYNSWNYCYIYALVDFDAIIKKTEPEGNLIYSGIAKTLKAYTTSMMVDLWGDIPYSEFNVPNLLKPKPDSSKDIYNALITLLESGSADLQNKDAVNFDKPTTADYFYGGDVNKWIQLNNTIRLKLLLQTRKAKSDITDWQSKFTSLITANNFMAAGNDFEFWYTSKVSPEERHPAYINEYASSSLTYYISPYFYEIMKGYTAYNAPNNPFSGISDPRVPYYFYNQLTATGTAQSNYEYRDKGFLSIFFASNGANNASEQSRSGTKIGIYPCGGKYDTGAGGAALNTGNGAAPHKMITYAASKFMMAELVVAGETTGDAKVLLQDALNAAIAHVNKVVVNGKQANVPTINNTDRDNFVNAILAKYDAADTPQKKMEIIMTQKWICNFFNPVDSYTDYRRTGYPILFDPNKTTIPGYGVNPTPAASSPAEVPTYPINSFPRSLYYPTTTETDLNPNMTQKTDLSQKSIFWDK